MKKYIEEQTKKGNGKFHLKDGEKELSLTLVKIHDDNFFMVVGGSAGYCTGADFKGDDSNDYDLDFVVDVDSEGMEVTEITIHKVNGKARYNWAPTLAGTRPGSLPICGRRPVDEK